jgi:DNA-directed RNA polymerase subunit alpha|uniref:DNA-directed RNA polymerase subunit alpha n=2 Tax=Thorea hispida TaxID=202687 RepID=A0A1Z1XAF6_9FLOR|nr:DNA-directed RNA polymerase alpha subunit [Thorea hispida]UNJ79119.1 DNA-directed RNA polymerase alpha subunit [Thorea hispida]
MNQQFFSMSPFQIECIESKVENTRQHYGRFIIEPLTRGQGITIGNALRRTILSDLSGTAIVAVRISGVNHEFSTIAGVREDVLEILLNLKEIVLKNHSDKPQIGRVRIQGPAIVTAGLFNIPNEIEIIDPRQYVATICNNTILEMEFCIEKGQGYRLVDKETINKKTDFLQIDAIFMPVKKFNYIVEEIKLNSQITQEKLLIELWTNGSLCPQEAISQGATILTNLFYSLCQINYKFIENSAPKEQQQIYEVSIEELQLSVRAYNCLKRAHIHSVSDLLNYSQEELLEIKNFGQKSANEVIEALQQRLGIHLPKQKINH